MKKEQWGLHQNVLCFFWCSFCGDSQNTSALHIMSRVLLTKGVVLCVVFPLEIKTSCSASMQKTKVIVLSKKCASYPKEIIEGKHAIIVVPLLQQLVCLHTLTYKPPTIPDNSQTYLLNKTMSGFQTLCGKILIVVIPPYSAASHSSW